jgi:hypothetical protein
MAWITGGEVENGVITGLDGVVVSRGGYFETRTDEDDPGIMEVRPHTTITTEFRGLADASLAGAFVSGLKTVTRTANHNGAGGYTITQYEDLMNTTAWTKLKVS